MAFDPRNHIVKICLQGMALEEQGKTEEAGKIFAQAWSEATDHLEHFLAAYYIARTKAEHLEKLEWLEKALHHATALKDETAQAALPALHASIAESHKALGRDDKAKQHLELANSIDTQPTDKGPFYHGTRAEMKVGDLLTPGRMSNYKRDLQMNHIYFTAMADGAGLAAALAKGDGVERVYIVVPAGSFENDPNVTNKKFPGNPTRSYRTTEPLKVTGEITEWNRQSPEEIKKWRERLDKSEGEIIN